MYAYVLVQHIPWGKMGASPLSLPRGTVDREMLQKVTLLRAIEDTKKPFVAGVFITFLCPLTLLAHTGDLPPPFPPWVC
jgi:hypothetical protein